MKEYLLVFFLFISFALHSQFTVKGTVVDEENQPLPYVNISIKRTTKGTSTDDYGNFEITIDKNIARLEFSYLGYKSVTKTVRKNDNFIKIILKEEENSLNEILVVTKPKKRLKKKENPAYNILKEIWKNKRSNGLKLTKYYEYKEHQTIQVGLDNLDSSYIKEVFKKDYETAINDMKYDEDGNNYYIPFFLEETIYHVYGNNVLNKRRKDIVAEKSDGVFDQGFIFNRMVNTFIDVNIYDDNFLVLNKSFVSPVSTVGFGTYDYVLNDSIITKDKKRYNIYFFPRRNEDFAFQGNFWVEGKNFSLTEIKMSVNKDINLNFVRSLSIEKEFSIENDTIFLPKKDFYSGNFTLLDKKETNKGLTITKLVDYSDFKLEVKKPDLFYDEQIEKYAPKQFEKPEDFWKQNSKPENANTYKLIDVVKDTKKIRNLTGLINTFASGYINMGTSLQAGPFWTFFAQNEIEGFRIKPSFRTFKTIDDRLRVNGYLAYGTKDKKLKFGGEAKYLLSYKPRISAGLAYVYDNDQLGAKLLNSNQLIGDPFGNGALFARGNNIFLSKVNKLITNINYQIKPNISVGLNFTNNSIVSADPNLFSIDYLKNNIVQSEIKDVTTDLSLTLTPGRFVYGLGVEQRFGKNLFPTIILNYKRGYEGFLNGSFSYDKLQFLYNQPIVLGQLGILDATVEGGKTFGTLPISLLSPIPANQTFSLVRNTFSLINYYDFVSDTYLTTHLEHHFNGFILNRIPLIKKLDLRSLVTFRAAYGTISQDNININRSSITYNAPDKNLYYEYGFGFENIGYGNLKFLRVDAIWRSNYNQVNTQIPQTPKFAIRIGIRPGL
ncbi:MAG: DUF5686 family protein [Polaribacter sp.]|uniref:DUF5686 family protein n=1 Tax=Polaribacter sp. TaxID=1920175 RepID=UPI003BB08181